MGYKVINNDLKLFFYNEEDFFYLNKNDDCIIDSFEKTIEYIIR